MQVGTPCCQEAISEAEGLHPWIGQLGWTGHQEASDVYDCLLPFIRVYDVLEEGDISVLQGHRPSTVYRRALLIHKLPGLLPVVIRTWSI